MTTRAPAVLIKGGTNLNVGMLWPIQAISAISVLFVCLFLVSIKGGTNLNVGMLRLIQEISPISFFVCVCFWF